MTILAWGVFLDLLNSLSDSTARPRPDSVDMLNPLFGS